MAKRKNQNTGKSGKGPREAVKSKEESYEDDSRQKETDPEDNVENNSGLQKAALLSALNIDTRRRHGEEEFDEDAADEEDYDDDDDDD